MSFFGDYVRSHFSACRHIANARDNCRDRDVKLFALPGEFDHVGVFDGTDAWIAPVIADPFSVDIKRVLQDIREGKPVGVHAKRHTLIAEPKRRAVIADTTPQPRKARHVIQT